ncbi:PQQ-dependent membrane bound dehydrogenase, glucose/quinate/shikimate-related [Trema orientale]|uniref:PQQ-dependent membrane bound dehydrogenase, glucose/quinate/shikimate-related n=1 Tax=Trema orientale TaxID=63057 RepID=A0A2P5EPL1_TREOI|nr:PQQ-dependent membrane bound dehydrogenase, glucose/quinate/shikimate-related [Trema orientale]
MSSDEEGRSQQSRCCSCGCISHQFLRAASRNPNKIALIHASSHDHPKPCCFTYSHLLASVHSLASRLRLRSPGVVGIYAPPSAEYVASVLAVLRCGQAFLPLDPSWPRPRVLSAMASSNVALVISTTSSFGVQYQPGWSDWLPDSATCPVLWFSLLEDEVEVKDESRALAWPCESAKQRPFCYVMYTSGSTGKPKGVCGTEQGLLNRFLWMQQLYPLNGVETLLFKTPISFVDHLQEFLSAVLTASTLVIPPFSELKDNVFSIVDLIQAYSIDRLTAVPSLMRTILPALEDRYDVHVLSSLKLLVLSGEVLPLSLWEILSKLLPGTSILNLYGSTEVSGDCTYFDCKKLPMILESEPLTSVPIGVPIANCDVVLVPDDDIPNQGEIYVSGLCNSAGYYSDSTFMSSDHVNLPHDYTSSVSDVNKHGMYFRTGDFAKRLEGGDLVFLGRKDRTIKLNGQRIALEEIEDTLRKHPDIADAAVMSHKIQGEVSSLVAFIILEKERSNGIFRSHIKSWMVGKLPFAMAPNCYIFTEAFPTTSSGKVDYESLTSHFHAKHVYREIGDVGNIDLLQVIKKAFCDVLMVEEVSDDDDFFTLGGNSIAAAHLSNNLGIDMRLLYYFPSPSKLCTTLLERKRSEIFLRKDANWEMKLKEGKRKISYSGIPNPANIEAGHKQLRTGNGKNENRAVISKRLKLESQINVAPEGLTPLNGYPWSTASMCFPCSFSRCNKVLYERDNEMDAIHQETCVEVPRNAKVSVQDLWKVYMGSCVDASPLIVFKSPDVYLFIGSHSHEFLCVNAQSGYVQWKIQLEGRIECSAAILGDFSQVVVGCYEGKLYFLDYSNGNICWTFQTTREVKSQPVVDIRRQLIWCGSHDHNLYALDYVDHCCLYKVPCGGSIFGSPVIDEKNSAVYVASTSGRITAISTKSMPFSILWLLELEVPVFGSLAMSSPNGYIICCLVDGHVLALDPTGSKFWKHKISGPIFAGACICSALPSQVLVCSRNGSIYSFEPEKGRILWEYNVGDPITASAYIDEHLCLTSDPSLLSDSSGHVILLRVNMDATREAYVEEVGRLDLQGDVFSSPVMLGGRIFVGCRDDYVHCLDVKHVKQNYDEHS